MKRFFLTLATMATLSACQNTPSSNGTNKETAQEQASSRIDSLKNLVMDVHDETMEQMGEIKRLRQDLAAVQDTTYISTAERDTAIDHLRKAHEGMMNWMRNYKEVDDVKDWSPEKKANYLKAQKDQVEQLKEYTAISLQEAKEILHKH